MLPTEHTRLYFKFLLKSSHSILINRVHENDDLYTGLQYRIKTNFLPRGTNAATLHGIFSSPKLAFFNPLCPFTSRFHTVSSKQPNGDTMPIPAEKKRKFN